MTKDNTISPICAGQRVVGKVRDGVFHKKVRSSVHFLRRPRLAICLDVQSLRDAMHAGAQWVEIEDIDTGLTYHAHVDTVRKRGKLIDRGYGRQFSLSLEKWEVDDPRITHSQLSFLAGVSV